MTTSESKDRFFLQKNESIRIDSHNESNRIDSNRELECSTMCNKCRMAASSHCVRVLRTINIAIYSQVGLLLGRQLYREISRRTDKLHAKKP